MQTITVQKHVGSAKGCGKRGEGNRGRSKAKAENKTIKISVKITTK
jgi:hypothetical protein